MKKVGQMLQPALQKEEVLRAARAYRILRDWPAVVGEAMAARSHPDRFDRGTVWVAVEGSAWAQELRMQKDQILRKLEEISGEVGLFVNVRFGVRPLPEAAVPEPPKKPKVVKREPTDRSIKEIAARRLENWPNGEDSSK